MHEQAYSCLWTNFAQLLIRNFGIPVSEKDAYSLPISNIYMVWRGREKCQHEIFQILGSHNSPLLHIDLAVSCFLWSFPQNNLFNFILFFSC